MLSIQNSANYSTNYPEQETPLGLFFSTNDPQSNRSMVSLRFSPALREDSLFLKQVNTPKLMDDELTAANIFFPEGVAAQESTITWPVDKEHSQSFLEFCQDQQSAADLELQQSILLKLCHMLHLVHYHNLASYPISSDMIRVSDQGEPMMLLLPASDLEDVSTPVKQAFFSSQFSAPETQMTFTMDPQAFTYNLGVLTALISGFSGKYEKKEDQHQQIKNFYSQLVAWTQQSENPQGSGMLKT